MRRWRRLLAPLALLLVRLEVRLAGPADRAEPVVGDLVERGPRGNSPVGVALVRVVDEPARGADPKLCGLGLGGHRAPAYRGPREPGRGQPPPEIGAKTSSQTRRPSGPR